MKTFIFRNHTVEPFFGDDGVAYSGYGDISQVPADADRYVWFYQVPVNADSEQLSQEVATYQQRLELVVNQIDTAKPIIVFSLENLFPLRLTGDETALRLAINGFNAYLAHLAAERHNVQLVDFSEFVSRYDAASLINWKFYFISQSLLNPRLAHEFQQWWQRVDQELALQRKKCLVLDLDNTLWGGVLGEDGIDGIKLGGDYPGNAFEMWQRALLQLSREGIILTICSKNNMTDVVELWEKNPFMILKRDNFAAMRINWQDKVTNLHELATELNIGLDSMVFVDDNPAERELVKQAFPMVTVPDFPDKPHQLMPFFKTLVERYFRCYTVTDEDRNKAEQYQANARRLAAQSSLVSIDDYLRSLDMQLHMMPADEHNLARIAQMTQKTNQFNLTTRRYTEQQVMQHLRDGWQAFCMGVSDRFGDSGITAAAILRPDGGDTVAIDSLLLSCRILGRGIEVAFLNSILNRLSQQHVTKVTADYLPTAKNGQTADFYDRNGFVCISQSEDGSKHYEMTLGESPLAIEDYYHFV